ncbi:MAG: hypothetical protein IPL59_05865 [Candidatus Competibacteraceae bacterium]|nr:hypothetical protein [Candidatus Competibacteraceae bacterium]
MSTEPSANGIAKRFSAGRAGARPDRESLVFSQDLPTILDIPVGVGPEHAEGLALFDGNGGDARSLPGSLRRRQEPATGRTHRQADLSLWPIRGSGARNGGL